MTFFCLGFGWFCGFFFKSRHSNHKPREEIYYLSALLSGTLPFFALSNTSRIPILHSLPGSFHFTTSNMFLFLSLPPPSHSFVLVFLSQDSAIFQTVPFGGQHLLDYTKIPPENTSAESLARN